MGVICFAFVLLLLVELVVPGMPAGVVVLTVAKAICRQLSREKQMHFMVICS